jgi:electron transfer flavoprotein alpha subunit
MRIAALVKQIPAFEEMRLGPDGRLEREGLDLEMNPYCRRAVSQAVELAHDADDGSSCTFITLGPPSAEDTLREALAWALERDVRAEGVLVTDPAFAGSDTLATARALAATLEHEGPFDLVLVGRNSVDSDTGQVGPELAELTGLPFLTGVRHLHLEGATAHARCEHDDGWVQAEVELPVLLSTAERLIEPCKMDPPERAAVPAHLVRKVSAADLGPGPWGAEGSPTWVGPVRVHEVARENIRLDGPVAEQVAKAVAVLARRDALNADAARASTLEPVPPARGTSGAAVTVVVEPRRAHATRELLGTASLLAAAIDGHVVALTFADDDHATVLAAQGADALVEVDGATVEEDAARAVVHWCREAAPWGVLASSTAWGREVMSRAAARLGAGLTGDAVALEVGDDGRLIAWKPAFGGQLVAAIGATSPIQMATVRLGMLPTLAEREAPAPAVTALAVEPASRVRVLARTRDDDLDTLAEAAVVVGVGKGIDPSHYDDLRPLLDVLGAELGATRKVTDNGWLPRARQIGITGRTIAPRLYVALAVGGKFNHTVGVRAAGTVLAVNADPDALVFDAADVGIVADWREVVPLLAAELARAHATA